MGKVYQSPYDPADPYNGLPVTILSSREVMRTVGSGETDTLLVVQLPNGHTITAWAEEITDTGD